MNPESVTQRLERHLSGQRIQAVLTSLMSMAGGILVFLATWGLSYLVSLVALGPWIGYRHPVHLLAGVVVLILAFVAYRREPPEYWSEYSVTPVGGAEAVTFYLPGVGVGSNVNPLAPDTVRAGAKIISDCLLVGPRLIGASGKHLRKAGRLRKTDIPSAAAVLSVLFEAGRKMSFQEIVERIEGLNPVSVFAGIREINGVLFLQADPPGLAMTPELKKAIFC